MPWATLLYLVYPNSLMSFSFALRALSMSWHRAKVPSPMFPRAETISAQQIFHVLPYTFQIPLQLVWATVTTQVSISSVVVCITSRLKLF